MSEQERLHNLIESAVEDVCYNSESYGPSNLAYAVADDAAEAIFAAGYRKPRTITTAEELDALQMAVIRSDAGTIANIVNGRAYFFGYEASTPAAVIALPATVLYEPTA